MTLGYDQAASLAGHIAGTYSAPSTLAVSGTSAETTGSLPRGLYRISCDVDVYFRRGPTGQTAVTTDRRIFGGTYLEIYVEGFRDDYIAAITGGAVGTLEIARVDY